MNRYLVLLLISCLGMTASVSAQGVYKYVKDGKVVYSDQPPPNVQAKKIEAYGSKRPTTQPVKPEQENQEDPRVKAVRSQECEKSRARLVQYQSSPVLKQSNLKGEEKELTSQERIDVLVRAQQDVNDLCDTDKDSEDAQANPDDA